VTERRLPAAALAGPQVAQLRPHQSSVSGGEGVPGLPKRQRTLPVDAPDSQAVIGHGWTAVLVKHDVSRAQVLQAVGGDQIATAVLNGFQPVQGSYGSGRLLRTSLLSALWLDDGRLLVGAVQPSVLERAASTAADRSSPSGR
jgi:hypothetical protein